MRRILYFYDRKVGHASQAAEIVVGRPVSLGHTDQLSLCDQMHPPDHFCGLRRPAPNTTRFPPLRHH